VIAFLMIVCSIAEFYFNNFNDTITFYIQIILLLFWGTIAGLSYKENFQYCVIKKAFLILLLAMTFVMLIASIWFSVIDPIERSGYFKGLMYYIAYSAVPVFLFMFGAFIIGYAIAFIVKFFSRLCKNIV